MKIFQHELAQKIAEEVQIPPAIAEKTINAFKKIITETLQENNSISLAGFGKFESRKRHGRNAPNPINPNQMIYVEDMHVPKFTAGYTLKRALKYGKQQNS